MAKLHLHIIFWTIIMFAKVNVFEIRMVRKFS